MSTYQNPIEINRGTGAGGYNTNASGLPFEKITELSSEYSSCVKNPIGSIIKFKNSSNEFRAFQKNEFPKFMKSIGQTNNELDYAHGCKQPDECYISTGSNKTITIIEKKNQNRSGSVCEKVQTGPMKRWFFQKTYPNYKINYVYTLSNWFKHNCKAELEYLKHQNIPVFWGDDPDYKNKIVQFINDN